VWQGTGYSAIIYLAALAGISPELQEAAYIDGANIWQRIWHVDIPGILPTAVILFILSTAGILNVGFEKVYLLQNPLNMSTSDVISTYTYRMGLIDMNYSLATAVGLFQSVISFAFMITVNQISKKVSETSLW
jgi:putative aldouronate transport system permease protein